MNEITCGDCLVFMRSLHDQSVDFTFYDPPYNVGKRYGTYQDNLPPDAYRAWQRDIAHEAQRISRRGMAVYVGSTLTKLFLELLPDAHLVVVHKRAIGARAGNWFLQYHTLFVVGTPLRPCKDLWDDIRLPGEGYYYRERRFAHPGQTALALVTRILHHFTDPGDLVCDPFMGTGTTAVAARAMSRHVIGCEIDPGYCAMATQRLHEASRQVSLLPTGDTSDPPLRLLPEQRSHLYG